MSPKVRPLAESDREAWLPLWQAYLAFYEEQLDDAVTDQTFTRLAAREQGMFAFVAELDGTLVGFVHCVEHPATWSSAGYCYLEDLFVAPSLRKGGVGSLLIESVYAEADRRSLERVYWHTHNTNKVARSLYERIGEDSGFLMYQRPYSCSAEAPAVIR